MVLGGLKEGVTPLEMAYAYSTIANRGKRVSGTFSASHLGPVAFTKVQRGGSVDKNKPLTKRVFSTGVGDQMRDIMHGVVMYGTGVQANVSEFAAGKTGTTENYGDAWFVGFTDKYTVAVWVGYPDRLKYMKTEYHGGPVAGGTFPAEIWHDFMTSAIAIEAERHPNQEPDSSTSTTPSVGVPSEPVTPAAPVPTTPAAPVTPAPTPQQQTPQQAPPKPAPAPQPAPQGGGGGGGGGAGGGGGNGTGGGGGGNAGGGTSPQSGGTGKKPRARVGSGAGGGSGKKRR
jgi:penicillin-binding protein 1A